MGLIDILLPFLSAWHDNFVYVTSIDKQHLFGSSAGFFPQPDSVYYWNGFDTTQKPILAHFEYHVYISLDEKITARFSCIIWSIFPPWIDSIGS